MPHPSSFSKSALPLAALILLASLLLTSTAPVLSAVEQPALAVQDAPETVTIPGTIQSKVGCPGDWQPDCDKTFLTYDPEDDIWQGAFDLPAGDYEYKVAIDKNWSENYGLNAVPSGANIPLALSAGSTVKFYYDHQSHWVTDNVNSLIVVAAGSFQSEIGCSRDNDPTCLLSWMQDPGGTGTYSVSTTLIPAGTYTVTAAVAESFDQTYGLEGVSGAGPYEFTVSSEGAEVYFGFDAVSHRLTISTEGAPRGDLAKAQAHWVTPDTILWDIPIVEGNTYFLHYDPDGAIQLGIGALQGGESIPLTVSYGGPTDKILTRFPHLSGYTAFKLSEVDLEKVPEILKGQLVVSARGGDGKLLDATSLQIPGVLDSLYSYSGSLGAAVDDGSVTLRVWAPTARMVSVLIFDASQDEVPSEAAVMTLDPATGVWSASGPDTWIGKYYLYEVQVFVPSTGKVESNRVTDPYSFSLSMNSLKSQVVDLSAGNLKPQGWDQLDKPRLEAPEDIVIYELHVRDFSAYDDTVPPIYRGAYMAFAQKNSNGMLHLRALAEAGLTHIHLLPVFDIATVEDDPSARQEPNRDVLTVYPGDSDQQAALISEMRDQDAYNWGYDPFHYTVPEGSYSTNPDGSARILEFRQMVQALNQTGLRVVMDVVYNHTSASGQTAKSVLDKIVPGYYYRLNGEGAVENSTCCQNTATEHAMMEKLMIDSTLTWATQYKVDGFRMDLMGHHMLSNVTNLRLALDALTLENDGVDGKSIYLYGEGWDFGEVAENARGKNATQLNIGGTGVGVFNDRLRDAARGGSPFDDPRVQGFLTGLSYQPNDFDQGSDADQEARLLRYMDWIRIGMAGNLADYPIMTAGDEQVPGSKIDYNGAPAGYTQDPQENIVYVSAHDNQILFDAIQVKASSDANLQDRVRMQNLGNALVLLSQGVPFFTAGDDILRSKSLDKNSYNSGDWFNAIDFSYTTNTWAAGLPPGDSQGEWEIDQPLLANEDLQISPQQIDFSRLFFLDMLKVRRSSPLFRLRTAQDIIERVSFLNTGLNQTHGLIVMVLDDTVGADLDRNAEKIIVLLNANPEPVTYSDPSFQGLRCTLNSIQAEGVDEVVKTSSYDPQTGTFTIPGRTAAVFIAKSLPVSQQTMVTLAAVGIGIVAVLTFGLIIIRQRRRR